MPDAPSPLLTPRESPRAPHPTWRLGAVSYLNAKPLIEGLTERDPTLHLQLDVPARLLSLLETDQVDLALCPVVDLHRSRVPLRLVPCGGIGCLGPTLTVRLFSQVPIDRITVLATDTDSHTSAALVQVLLKRLYGLQPRIEPLPTAPNAPTPEAMLLIGDKVVNRSDTTTQRYPHQLDLGDAWHTLTGGPFVFAVWQARQGTELGDLPDRLAAHLAENLRNTQAIADRHAAAHRWPVALARTYLGQIMRYTLAAPELQAIATFSQMLLEDGLVDALRPLQQTPAPTAPAAGARR